MEIDNSEAEDYWEPWEPFVYFNGPCTCDHTPEQHGWGSCNIEGCSCEAGWEE